MCRGQLPQPPRTSPLRSQRHATWPAVDCITDVVQRAPLPDLIITDLGIPGREDRPLIAERRRLTLGVPILYTSGYPRHVAHWMYDFPADAPFMAKPFSVHDLVAAVDELLAAWAPA